MKELFIKEVLDSTNHFLDNNQRIKLKEKLIEICLNYQIKIKEQAKSQETQKNNADILYIQYEFSRKKLYCFG